MGGIEKMWCWRIMCLGLRVEGLACLASPARQGSERFDGRGGREDDESREGFRIQGSWLRVEGSTRLAPPPR